MYGDKESRREGGRTSNGQRGLEDVLVVERVVDVAPVLGKRHVGPPLKLPIGEGAWERQGGREGGKAGVMSRQLNEAAETNGPSLLSSLPPSLPPSL